LGRVGEKIVGDFGFWGVTKSPKKGFFSLY